MAPNRDRVMELLSYCSDTGLFYWRVDRLTGKGMRKIKTGSIAGTTRKGYTLIGIDGVQYSAHRLAWLVVYDDWPLCDLDHINRVRTDNRISNLRSATRSQNLANSSLRSDNTTGSKGIWYWAARKKWKAYLRGRTLGYFHSKDEALAAYDAAAKREFGPFARTS